MAGPEAVPVLPPEEALRFFRRKGFAIGFAWQDVWQDEHAKAFTVAKAMSRDLLEEIRAAVDKAIADGETLDQFRKNLRPKLEARGWWGRRSMVDPQTGEQKIVQLGSPRRLKTIFQVNMRTAYAAGRWERIQRTKSAFPYIRYVSVKDGREREEHGRWHGTILPVDHVWWDTHYPPCGWNCRCTPQSLNLRQIERRGWSVTSDPVTFPSESYVNKRTGEVSKVERGIDPGWSYNVGKAYLDGVAPRPLPSSFGSDDVSAATDFGAGAEERIAAFLEPFGIEPGGERVFLDGEGWPLAMSAGWFREIGGRFVVPGNSSSRQLGRVGRAIVEPDAIAWRWVTAEDGRKLLMRCYLARVDGIAIMVDVGGAGWRFRLGKG